MSTAVVASSELVLADDHLVADFPYDAAQVAEIKQIDGAKWDKADRVWRIPLASIEAARRFAQRHGFWIDTEVLRFDLSIPSRDLLACVDGDHISIRFPYDPVKIQAIKRSVPGAFFDPASKTWHAPFASTAETLEWAVKFGAVVDDDLLRLHRERLETTSLLVGKSRSVEDFVDIPTLQATLRPYQHAGVAYALASRRCFIADEMGTGKTVMSLATLEAADAWPAVVVCPPSLTLNWKAEANRWLPHRSVNVITGRKEFGDPADLTVVGWSNLATWVTPLRSARGYVFDESHYAKTSTTKRTKAAIKVARSAPSDGVVLCLTGTPITNRPNEFVAQLDILGRLKEFGGRVPFWLRYCDGFRDKYGVWHIDGASNLEELNDRLRSTCYIRRTKAQVMKDLPPIVTSRVLVPGDSKVMVEYRRAEADIARFLAERAAAIAEEIGANPRSAAVMARIKAESAEHLVRIATLRQLAARAKMSAVAEWVETLIEADSKVVLAAHHRDVVSELAMRFGGLKIQGGQPVEEVEAHKSRFQTDPEAKVITLSIQAAKTGHTLTAAQDIGFVELPFTPADVDQTVARLHRIGQEGVVTAHYLLTAGTIDEDLWTLIEDKRAVVDAATEGGDLHRTESVGAALTARYTQMGLEML